MQFKKMMSFKKMIENKKQPNFIDEIIRVGNKA